MSLLGITFEEKYTNFFNFFSNKHNKSEIEEFIKTNKISSYSNSYLECIYLNMIDSQNLNILFHIIIKSDSDLDCLQKLKFLIEEYNINYNAFDYIHHRTLPFYTCVKGYLESTKYLLDKMNFNINYTETDGKTLFFSAIKSYNIELMEYLDNKYPNSIFCTDDKNNSCIFNIFKKDIKNLEKKEDIEKLKNILRFILKRGFKIDEKNVEGISFREKCSFYQIDGILNDVIEEFGGEIKRKNKNDIKENDNEIISGQKLIQNGKNELKKESEEKKVNSDKIEFKNQNIVKNKYLDETEKEKNNEVKPIQNNLDYDIEMDDDFINNESRKELYDNELSINKFVKEDKKINYIKNQNRITKKKVCAFLSKKRHNLILREETLNSLRNNKYFQKYFISTN